MIGHDDICSQFVFQGKATLGRTTGREKTDTVIHEMLLSHGHMRR
jgi:hypothetical protein